MIKRSSFESIAQPHLLHQPLYEPGNPIATVARVQGLDPKRVIKLASNENPLGPSPLGLQAAREALEQGHRYPDGACSLLREKLASLHAIAPQQIILGCGSNEIFEFMGHVFLGPGQEAVMGTQSFPVYKLLTLMFGAKPIEVPMPNYTHDLEAMLEAITLRTRLVFLPSPNNPTGTANTQEALYAFVKSLPEHLVFVFDEAYAEYLDAPPDLRPYIAEGRNIICTRTFSKIYGLAALRLGYGYGPTGIIELLNRVRQPFNVNAIAQAAGVSALEDTDFLQASRQMNRKGRDQLMSGLRAFNLQPVPSEANFVLVSIPDSDKIAYDLQTQGVIVRPIPSLLHHLRLSIGTPDHNRILLAALSAALERTD